MKALSNKPFLIVGTGLLLTALSACETPTNLNAPATMAPVESRSLSGDAAAAAANTGAAAGVTPQSQVASVDLTRAGAGAGAGGATAGMPTQRVVYFDYDSFAIKDDYKPVIDAHAKVLVSQSARRLVIEGHTDERGGREYNLALGQKRAQAVLRSLALLGVAEGRLEAVSFGQERPAVQGSDESAFARNRRAELKDR
jgi:peptidoglycan-associated lipoprotein